MLRLVSRRFRIAILVGAAIGVALTVYPLLFGGSGKLKVIYRHDLRDASVWVSVDGKLVRNEIDAGTAKKRWGLLGKPEQTYTDRLEIQSGEHEVAVRLRSIRDGYDEVRTISVNIAKEQESTLVVSASRGGKMSASFQDAADMQEGSGYSRSMLSLLTTLVGTACSAAVAFVVQEFLRSKKPIRPEA